MEGELVNGVRLADILFIIFICCVIYGIMALVNRGKKKSPAPPGEEKESRRKAHKG
jgi:Na+-transporting methylmalonyl-CoA/oxaloacetate decarboxylase gamma subunit